MYRLEASIVSGAAVVRASGELDAFAAPELATALEERGSAVLVVDLSAVSFLDSTALGTLVKAVRERREAGGRTAVVLPAGPARRIFEITGLDGVLPVFVSTEAALAAGG